MEVKNKLLKVVALILFFVALFAGFFAYALYKENIIIVANAVELNEKIATLENEVESYKTKIKTISEILNTALDTEVVEDKQEEEKKEITELSGTYEYIEPGSDILSYTFNGKDVVYEVLHTQKGTYVIEGNKVKITYTEGTDPEGNLLTVDKLPDGEKDEITIIDEDTLEKNGVQFKKVEE